ncbi:MAG TPA: hypothetical protein VF898_08620 [Chloroflexota bacterium]
MTDVTPHDLANAVMGQLYDVLTNGDDTVPKSVDNYFSWMTPGIPMDPSDFDFLTQGLTGVVKPQDVANLVVPVGAGAGAAGAPAAAGGTPSGGQTLTSQQINELRAQDTNRVYMQAEMVARLVDFVPEVSKINNNQFAQFNVSNNEGTLSDRYNLILKMSQVMYQELDADTQAKIAKFRSLLQTTTTHTDLVTGEQTQVVGPSPMVRAYNDKMAAYDAAALTYNNARIAALAGTDPAAVENFAINASILRNQVKAAMDDWITNGYKTDYEEIAAYIDQVQQRDMKLLKQEYEDDLDKARLTGISSGSDFFFTSLIPGNFPTSSGWTRFWFNSGNYSTYSNYSFNSSGWAAQAGGSFMGLFGGGGSASGSSTSIQSNFSINLDSFNLGFEIAQIPIVRPWFKEVFITSKTWRFDPTNPDVKNDAVSDGASPPQGIIAAYPTTAIFIRNLQLGIMHDSQSGQFIDQYSSSSQSGGGFANFGPFFIGGSASHYSSSGYTQHSYDHQWNDQGLSVPGMQLVGFKCHIFPKSPNPDPSIKSWV